MGSCKKLLYARLTSTSWEEKSASFRTESKLKKLTERTQLLESTVGSSSLSGKNVCLLQWKERNSTKTIWRRQEFFFSRYPQMRNVQSSNLKYHVFVLTCWLMYSITYFFQETGTQPCSFEEQQRLSVLASQRRTTTILASMVHFSTWMYWKSQSDHLYLVKALWRQHLRKLHILDLERFEAQLMVTISQV